MIGFPNNVCKKPINLHADSWNKMFGKERYIKLLRERERTMSMSSNQPTGWRIANCESGRSSTVSPTRNKKNRSAKTGQSRSSRTA